MPGQLSQFWRSQRILEAPSLILLGDQVLELGTTARIPPALDLAKL
ncbi:MAG: hypothetical protein Q9N32_05715 [Gammaproteobacteria bacterium]|nr:hypothetical protein [Gammaproteobacteria bacterium]